MYRHRRAISATLLLLALAGGLLRCSEPAEPLEGPGDATLRLVSPAGDEGAAILAIDAGPVLAVTSETALVYTYPDGDRLRVVLVSVFGGELSATVAVDETTTPLNPEVIQVAGPDNMLRTPLTGYAVQVAGS